MYKFLPNARRGIFSLLLLMLCGSVNSQTLKTQTNHQSLKKGHALYKQMKIYDSKTGAVQTKLKNVPDRASDRISYEFDRVKNPFSGEVPVDIRDLELKFSSKIQNGTDLKKSISSRLAKNGNFSYWVNRGPFNVGGRTRALAIDRTNENIILAAGVSGGMWRSTNSGQSWKKVTSRRQTPSVSAIVQDPRPGQGRTWYYGTGERFGTVSAPGAFYSGSGIFKSTNGGRTWRVLRATNDGDVTRVSPLDLVNSMVINPVNGDLYVGTFNGVHRSQDGGNSFEEVLVGGFDSRMEVAVTSRGRLYATIAVRGVPNSGFFTSTDGDTWTNITPEELPASFGRTVMGIDPSNENVVYFLSANNAPETVAFLFRYNASASPEESWVDLSANLPTTIGGSIGNLDLQGQYNMVIKVHPADSNIVFVGGTNLYRSTTGFTTPAGQESWIGGYSPLNDVSVYPDQHPDQHELVFYPSNPNRALSGSDGGVSITEDITATNTPEEPVDWTSLNNGYITTHPYHVAFDPDANSDDLISGFQDNGTWYTNSTDPEAAWISDFGGDGTYSAIADGGRARYFASQFGNLFRINLDENGAFVSFTKIRPAGAIGFSFVNPFILDPNNDNIMYMPIGNRIWRNNNLDEIPLFSFDDATVNWVQLTNTTTPSGSGITALDVSKYPIANRLYYGTNGGGIYRMDNANLDNQEVVDVSSGKGFPPGTVNDINVDPSNPDRVIVTFSNYGIQSLFLTDNGGETWTNVSGNLEENADGTGNGPSVRGTAFLGSSTGRIGANAQTVFAATSTGLYSATRLNGENTRWRKEAFVIGDATIDEVVTRKDGFVAVAAHGNGLFSARFPLVFNPLPEPTLSVAYALDDIEVNENSEGSVVDITDLFIQSGDLPINIQITNSNPDLVSATLLGNTIVLSYTADSIGQATIGLIATSGDEQVSQGFNVTISEPSIYEQVNPEISNVPSQFFLDFGGLAQSADDFTIPEGNTWKIDRVLAFGGVNGSPALTNTTVIIYEDNDGIPGAEVYNSGQFVPISEPNDGNLNMLLPEAITLSSGNYWLSVYVNLAFNPAGNQWFWLLQEGGLGQEPHFKDEFNLFGLGATDWTPLTIAFGRPLSDQIFQIFGDIEDTGTDTTIADQQVAAGEPLAILNTDRGSIVWPNPSSDRFTFDFRSLGSTKNISLLVFDISGKLVFEQSKINTNGRFVWNASQNTSGFYFVKISGPNVNKTLKILKK